MMGRVGGGCGVHRWRMFEDRWSSMILPDAIVVSQPPSKHEALVAYYVNAFKYFRHSCCDNLCVLLIAIMSMLCFELCAGLCHSVSDYSICMPVYYAYCIVCYHKYM